MVMTKLLHDPFGSNIIIPPLKQSLIPCNAWVLVRVKGTHHSISRYVERYGWRMPAAFFFNPSFSLVVLLCHVLFNVSVWWMYHFHSTRISLIILQFFVVAFFYAFLLSVFVPSFFFDPSVEISTIWHIYATKQPRVVAKTIADIVFTFLCIWHVSFPFLLVPGERSPRVSWSKLVKVYARGSVKTLGHMTTWLATGTAGVISWSQTSCK